MGIGFGRGKDCEVVIEHGMSTRQIAEQLKECGAVKIPMLFRVYAKLKHYDGKFKYGLYTFNNEAGYEALSVMLREEGAKANSIKVTIPEMSSVDDIAKILEEKGIWQKTILIDEFSTAALIDFVKAIPTEKVYYHLRATFSRNI